MTQKQKNSGAKTRKVLETFRVLNSKHLLILLIALYFGWSVYYVNQRHLAFETGAFDTGVYAQPIWNYTQGQDFAVSLIEDNGPIRWATHVEPILYFIVPIYALFPDPRLLFVIQIAALTLAAIPMYALAIRRIHNEWAALVIVLAYFLMPATESVTLFDFHAVTLAPLFLLSAVYFLDRALSKQGISLWLWPLNKLPTDQPTITKAVPSFKTAKKSLAEPVEASFPSAGSGRFIFLELPKNGFLASLQRRLQTALPNYLLTALFFLLALSTKEDISLHVFMIGLYLLLLRRRWWEGGTLIAVGLIWFYVTFQIIIPSYRTAGGESIYAAWFETLGNTPLEIAYSPITKPDKVFDLIFRPGNIPALLMISAPLTLLPIAGLPMLAMTAPSVAFVLLSNNPTLRQLETWHYASPMLAFVMLATMDGLARVTHYGTRLIQPRLGDNTGPYIRNTMVIMLLCTSLTYHYYRGYSPLSALYEPITVTAHHELGREIASTIPADSSVLAQAQLIPYVAHRLELGIWSGPLLTEYDYVWLDLSHQKIPNRFNAHGDFLTGLIIEDEFGFVTMQDGYMLLQRGSERPIMPESFFTFTEYDQLPTNTQQFDATFGDTFRLVGAKPEVRRLATSETEPQLLLYFEVLQAPAQDYHLFLYLLDEHGEVIGATDYPQPALFWWPTSQWKQSDQRQIRINTIPWWTGDKTAFGYAIGLSHNDDPWDKSARLPISWTAKSANPTNSMPIQDDTLLPIVAFERWGGLTYEK
ncbi:DUF2079 domain-containing protein [Anaerolineales bacterium HSG24]|nr:DUF2079 domain-containing protein [Anaerolineales bacterium HSG24]